jgi:two-component system, LytTR family, response regulator LytT
VSGLSVLAVDDEPAALDDLVYLLRQHDAVESVTTATDSVEALRLLHGDPIDALFLDIHMPGLDGMEVARLVRRFAAPPAVVFVTAYDGHAVEAFEIEALDFLVKPVRPERLDGAIRKVLQLRQLVDATEQGGAEPSPASAPRHEPSDHVPVEVGNRIVLVPRADITHVEASGDYVRLFTASTSFLWRASLNALEARWADAGYVRIHRRYLVALSSVRELRSDGDGAYRVIVGKAELPVSRRHAREVKERLTNGDRVRATRGPGP